MKKDFCRPESLTEKITHYCPGCGHGIIHRLIAEVVDELKIREKVIGVAPVGCAVLAYDYFNFDVTEAAHGRTPAVATGIKRALPDKVVFTYQGDGDLAAIGTAEIVHTANRGENLTVIFVNNAVYGMTGGQMAPTTILGQKTTTSPFGRDKKREGFPLKITEMLKTLDGVVFLSRESVHRPANIIKAKKALKKAFQNQIDEKGFSLVEILASCPTNWKLSPRESIAWMEKEMIKTFPLGIIKEG
ncbi:MAG: thiamine pyrophosphate-dependent enzyme [Candidatus Ratteibacteria bacterium]|nr:thiamine pyrophosphate-dependent enzyme [Candidatus Ratteibacteria bacterium]